MVSIASIGSLGLRTVESRDDMEMIIQVVTFIIIPLDFIHKSYIHIVQYVSNPQIATYINLSFFWHSSEIYDYTKVRIVQYQALAGL